MLIKSACNSDVVRVSKNASIQEAAILMKNRNTGTVIVVNDAANDLTPCGILTDRDIVMEIIADDVDINKLTVGDAMNSDLLVVEENEEIDTVIEKMVNKGVRRVPVVNSKHKLAGVVAVDDLVVLLSDELQDVARIIYNQVKSSKQVRVG